MDTILAIIFIWFASSIPAGIIMGKLLSRVDTGLEVPEYVPAPRTIPVRLNINPANFNNTK